MASLDDLIAQGIPPDVARYIAATPSTPDSGSPAHQPFWQPDYWPTPYRGQQTDNQIFSSEPPSSLPLQQQLGRQHLAQEQNYPQSEGETWGRTPMPHGLLGSQQAGPPMPWATQQPSLYQQLMRHLGIAP